MDNFINEARKRNLAVGIINAVSQSPSGYQFHCIMPRSQPLIHITRVNSEGIADKVTIRYPEMEVISASKFDPCRAEDALTQPVIAAKELAESVVADFMSAENQPVLTRNSCTKAYSGRTFPMEGGRLDPEAVYFRSCVPLER